MSGIRVSPPDDFVKIIVSLFFPNPDFNHIIEINTSVLNKQKICDEFIFLYPEFEIYYYPSKLKALQDNDGSFSFNSCICILRQLLRNKGFTVHSKIFKRSSSRDKLIIIRPPTL